MLSLLKVNRRTFKSLDKALTYAKNLSLKQAEPVKVTGVEHDSWGNVPHQVLVAVYKNGVLQD